MTFDEFIKLPASKKIVMAEVDTPLTVKWINFKEGLWYNKMTPGDDLIEDDNGNFGFYGNRNTEYFNIKSLNINGELYLEADSLAVYEVTDKSWFYDKVTTNFYIHLESFQPPESFIVIAPGAVIGFTKGVDTTVNNYFEEIYYQPILKSVPNFTKKKDALFFGILQFQGGILTFENTGGELDKYATINLYGQPVRIKLTFEGLEFSQARLVYTGRVGRFDGNFKEYKMKILDIRQLFSRKLPIHSLSVAVYPSMDSELEGVPLPVIWGPVEKVPAYRTSAGNWIFCDVEFNDVDSGIVVTNESGSVFSHGGTETDGTFTGSDTSAALFVTCRVSVKENGLDVIADSLENYENRDFNNDNYVLDEWNAIQPDISNIGIWIGAGNLKTTAEIIQQVCTDNQGILDVLSDGRITFVKFDSDKEAALIYEQDEIMGDPELLKNPEEYLSSVKVLHSKNWQTGESRILTNSDFEAAVFARNLQYKEKTFPSRLTNDADAKKSSNAIMELSQFILPTIKLNTKTQKIAARILDNAIYIYKRQKGNPIIDRALYQVLGLTLNLSSFEILHTIKFIKLKAETPTISGELNGAVYGLDVYGLDVYGL